VRKPPPLGTPNDPKTMVFQIGPLRLTGAAALVATIVLFGAIIAALVYYRARILSSPLSISAALWIGFVVYWNVAAGNTVPTKSRESQASRQVHTWLLNAAMFLVFVPVPGLDRRILPEGRWVVAVGIVIHLASFLLALSARRHLGRFWSGEITQKVGHQLIRSGPYRLVRHPLYVCEAIAIAGNVLRHPGWPALLLAAMALGFQYRRILHEERVLVTAFPEYSAYAKRVPMFGLRLP